MIPLGKIPDIFKMSGIFLSKIGLKLALKTLDSVALNGKILLLRGTKKTFQNSEKRTKRND